MKKAIIVAVVLSLLALLSATGYELFTQPRSAYPTILPPAFAISLIFVINIIAFAGAFFTSSKMSRFKWLPHAVALAWLVCSPVLAAILALPYVPPDESPGPGDGFILLPILGEVAACLLGYVLVGAAYAFRPGIRGLVGRAGQTNPIKR